MYKICEYSARKMEVLSKSLRFQRKILTNNIQGQITTTTKIMRSKSTSVTHETMHILKNLNTMRLRKQMNSVKSKTHGRQL